MKFPEYKGVGGILCLIIVETHTPFLPLEIYN